MNYIKNNKVVLLLIGVVVFTFIRIAAAFYSGYSAISYDVLSFLSTEPVRYLLIITCSIIIVIAKDLSRNRKVSAFVALTFLLLIGLVPTGHFLTLGALFSIHNANPQQIRNDARVLMDKYEAKTYFSDEKNQRFFINDPIPKNKLPLSLQNANIKDVLVLDDYVFIEKFGMRGLFRGFIVFREGSDIWKNEKDIVLLNGCSYCWKIRVIDGLYWYHAVPTKDEVATVAFPLK